MATSKRASMMALPPQTNGPSVAAPLPPACEAPAPANKHKHAMSMSTELGNSVTSLPQVSSDGEDRPDDEKIKRLAKLFNLSLDNDSLLFKCSCACKRGNHGMLLQQGRMYITRRYILFYSALFNSREVIAAKEVLELRKKWPLMIEFVLDGGPMSHSSGTAVATNNSRHVVSFTSFFGCWDKAFSYMTDIVADTQQSSLEAGELSDPDDDDDDAPQLPTSSTTTTTTTTSTSATQQPQTTTSTETTEAPVTTAQPQQQVVSEAAAASSDSATRLLKLSGSSRLVVHRKGTASSLSSPQPLELSSTSQPTSAAGSNGWMSMVMPSWWTVLALAVFIFLYLRIASLEFRVRSTTTPP